jgi:hypothetical protein
MMVKLILITVINAESAKHSTLYKKQWIQLWKILNTLYKLSLALWFGLLLFCKSKKCSSWYENCFVWFYYVFIHAIPFVTICH